MNANVKITLPVKLIILLMFTSILSMISINNTLLAMSILEVPFSVISFSVITILLAVCACLAAKKSAVVKPVSTKAAANKNSIKSKINIYQITAYLLLFIGLFFIWQQLEIPSLTAIAALLTLLAWAKSCELKTNRDVKFNWF
jgi:hypothetical protein